MKCIHYGTSKYDPSKFLEIGQMRESCWVKPRGGLWASPLDSCWGWKDWCMAEEFNTANLKEFFIFDLIGNILVIDSLEDAGKKLEWIEPEWAKEINKKYTIRQHEVPYFGSLLSKGVDAVHLTARGEQQTRFSERHSLYGWDCDSVLVLNKGAIHIPEETIKEEKQNE